MIFDKIRKLAAMVRYETKIFAIYLYNEHLSHWPFRKLRVWYLKTLLGSFGQDISILMHVYFMNPSGVHIGDRSVINQHCIIDGRVDSIWIGSDVDIGTHTHIWTLQHNPQSSNHDTQGGSVRIENNVWIASRVTILPNLTIGAGAVIATGSVVTGNVPSQAIFAGVPARQIGIVKEPPKYQLNFHPKWR